MSSGATPNSLHPSRTDTQKQTVKGQRARKGKIMATTMSEYIKKLRGAGATVSHQESNNDCPGGYFRASKGDQMVEVFFNGDDRFHDATVLGKDGEPLRRTLRTMAAVERHLGF